MSEKSDSNMVTVDKYFQFLLQEKLMGSKCPACGRIDLPARRLCSKCQAESAWIQLNGKGTLATFTAVSVGNKVMNQKGYDRKKPYVFAVGKMEEGCMVSGQLTGVDETKPENIKIGMAIKTIFLKSEIGKDKDGKPIMRADVGFAPA